MKKTIDPFDYAGDFPKNMKRGLLLTTRDHGQTNTMTIGWGTLGVIWRKPVFIAYVRQSRYTREILDRTGEFTISAPYGDTEPDSRIFSFCGSKSGREVDKIKELGLHLEEPSVISAPAIRELPLTLECRVIYRQAQDVTLLENDIQQRYYPEGKDGHIAYYGEIVSAYLVED